MSPRDRGRTLAMATAVLAVIWTAHALGQVDPRSHWIFAGWVLIFIACTVCITRVPERVVAVVGMVPAVTSLLAILGLAALEGGVRSPWFYFVPMLPLLSALVVPEDLVDAAVVGAVGLAGGTWLLAREGLEAGRVAAWAVTLAVGTAFALLYGWRWRQRLAGEVWSERGRLEALARLGESEREREKAERLAAVGAIADGVAHELNSPLAALRSNLAFVREELGEAAGGEAGRALDDATEGVERIRAMVATLLRLAPTAEVPREPADLAVAVSRGTRLASLRLPPVSVTVEAPDEPVMVRAHAPMLADLVLQLSVATAASEVRLGIRPGAGSVRLVAEGHGPTRPEEPGPRLALALCHEYARRLNGELLHAGPARLEVVLARA